MQHVSAAAGRSARRMRTAGKNSDGECNFYFDESLSLRRLVAPSISAYQARQTYLPVSLIDYVTSARKT